MINRLAHLQSHTDEPHEQLATAVPADVLAAVVEFSEFSDIPLTEIVEESLRKYLMSKYWRIEEDDGEDVE